MAKFYEQRWRATSACLATLMLVAACSSTPEDTEATGITQNSLLQEALNDNRVDPSQISILESSALDYGAYESAMNSAFKCSTDKGIEIQGIAPETTHGNTRLNYAIGTGNSGLSLESATALFDECYEKYAIYVDQYWQLAEPSAVAWQARRESALKEPLQACLKEIGQDVADDSSFQDLSARAAIIATPDDLDSDCFTQIGYDEWDG